MSFVRPTLSELIERARADFETRLPGADARLRRSVLDVLARTHAGAASGLYGYLDFLARQLMPDTAEAEFLSRWASIWGVQRKSATVATGPVRVTGQPGTLVPAEAELVRIDGARFRTIAAAQLAGASAELTVEALADGPAGNADTGATMTFVQTVPGLAAVATVLAPGISGGAAQEDDAGLLGRLLERIRRPPNGGARSDYASWALEVPGVTRAWAYPLYLGPGTVGVTFVVDGRADILPTPAEVAAVAAYIEERRPVTAAVTVFAPTPVPVPIRVRLAPSTIAVQEAVRAELADLFARDAEPGGTIWSSRLREAISLAQGEFSHELVAPDFDTVASPGFMPMLGDIEFLE